MQPGNIFEALNALEKEKGISKEIIIDAIKTALISAYKRNFGDSQSARVDIDVDTGKMQVFAEKEVVDDVFDDSFEISLEDAKAINAAYELGDVLEIEVTPSTFGRIAAQTAKQVVVQKIREAERGVVYDQYQERENEILTGVVHRIERGCVYLELDRAEGILPMSEAIPGEKYMVNARYKVYVIEVRRTAKGPQIVTSRSHPGLVKRLFELEVPEIAENVVTIKSIAREAGHRTKIAVYSEEENIDPVGACVGPKGSRIEQVVDELSGERIDVIPYDSDPAIFISNALRPAKVILVQVNPEEKAAKVVVPDYQLSLAIGKEGQNARLAAKLTGYKIDIKSQSHVVDGVFGEAPQTEQEDSLNMSQMPSIDLVFGKESDFSEPIDGEFEGDMGFESDEFAQAQTPGFGGFDSMPEGGFGAFDSIPEGEFDMGDYKFDYEKEDEE